jgi:hypothetical protein
MLRLTILPLAAVGAAAAFAIGAGATPSAPRGNPCAAKPSQGTPHASTVGASALNGGKPVDVDQRKVPKVGQPRPSSQRPHQVPQPGYNRAKKLKSAKRTCTPHSVPTASAAPARP